MADAPLFTVAQVAERLGVGDETVLAHIASKRLAASNVGLGTRRPRWRITPEALDRFLSASTAPKPVAARRRKRLTKTIEFF